MACNCISFLGFLLVAAAAALSAFGLFGGYWVGARAVATDGQDTSAVSFGFGPSGACYRENGEEVFCTTPEELADNWPRYEDLINPNGNSDVTGENVGELLQRIQYLMITAMAACGFCLVVFAPIFVGDLCASGMTNGCTSCMAAIGGLVVALGGAAAFAAFGLMADSEVRRVFEDHWSSASYSSGGNSYELDTGDSLVMYAAAVAGGCAVLGGMLAIGRGTACTGQAKPRA